MADQTRAMPFRRAKLRSTLAMVGLLGMLPGLPACSSKQGESEKLLAARTTVERAESLVNAGGSAQADLDKAHDSLAQAEAARKKGRPQQETDNFAYSAEQSATAAINRQEAALLQKEAGTSEDRQRDATMALHKAETAETEAQRVQQLAQQSAAAR